MSVIRYSQDYGCTSTTHRYNKYKYIINLIAAHEDLHSLSSAYHTRVTIGAKNFASVAAERFRQSRAFKPWPVGVLTKVERSKRLPGHFPTNLKGITRCEQLGTVSSTSVPSIHALYSYLVGV